MKVKEIEPFIGKDVIIHLKTKEQVSGYLSNIVSSLEADSGKDEIDLDIGGMEMGIKFDEIETIRVQK